MNAVQHALTCAVRARWKRWRYRQPFWCDDRTAQAVGMARFGCRRCGRGAVRPWMAWP